MKVNEIFYSLQGEGYYTGHPAVFLRLSGCNLSCPFCDTKHQTYTEMTDDQIVKHISQYPARHIVITGGEPGLQLTSAFIHLLHAHNWYVQVETNGITPIPDNADWITCSPKTPLTHLIQDTRLTHTDHHGQKPIDSNDSNPSDRSILCAPSATSDMTDAFRHSGHTRIDELKLLFLNDGSDHQRATRYSHIPARRYSLQPLDTGNLTHNQTILTACISYIQSHPHWTLSLQTHKLLNIP